MCKRYDIIVIGAGHAGCEAALAAARMGCKTLLTTIHLDSVAGMPCSPSIGGTGKGQLVKEVDALGGAMARVTDRTAISYRTLNTRKGPAVQSTRTQNDKHMYHQMMKQCVEDQPNLDLKQAKINRLVLDGDRVAGVVDHFGYEYQAEAVILATGTFLSGVIHIGHKSMKAGRAGEFASYSLASHLMELGFAMGRMKTGTPARVAKDSIDFSCFEEQTGEENPRPFSLFSKASLLTPMSSFMGRTNERTHRIIRDNLSCSALYGGIVKGVSARYCPSFEDKIVKFPERESHQIILEHEGVHTREIYVSGLGNSMPLEVQIKLYRSIPGMEQVEIMRPAYAIEYDFLNPTGLKPTLETKLVKGLYAAGQINGTSGYEEAGAQGMWAGINAACKIQGRPPFLPDRSEAYMAVMVDDLVTRGTSEPYRMFTSRAEYRLMLREDNPDLRLMEYGHGLGLIDDDAFKDLIERKKQIQAELDRVRSTIIKPLPEVNQYLEDKGTAPLKEAAPLDRLMKRVQLGYDAVEKLAPSPEPINPRVSRQVEIAIKYEGYIAKQLREIEKFREMERVRIPEGFDFEAVHGLSNELKAKLGALKPVSLGQASRMEGITPAALSAVMIHLHQSKNTEVENSSTQ
ncbi:tRNA uridine-5-carboxymethylaminomethyl(34) synthesis enzyme MnmG [Desulfatibacillum aliphaticivorans]|uniref:tRNA uridine-5-carboxymethylaminomethyl(34) synthesis enzyme MnmG n=1 Tax=Desulfatibacillum aliphaticivorans TaxID=218208 RepID=UPI00040DA80A|nr:tRNA uridine-5-carboxymethylaminomethyl(34) synthesis enzyme MnmG [Desulfatibacillum aliphaticivorans]